MCVCVCVYIADIKVRKVGGSRAPSSKANSSSSSSGTGPHAGSQRQPASENAASGAPAALSEELVAELEELFQSSVAITRMPDPLAVAEAARSRCVPRSNLGFIALVLAQADKFRG